MASSETNSFIKRLEDEAGITNELLLSAQEISHGRVLLSRAQAALKNPNLEATWAVQSQSTLTLTEHISRLSVAIAPHKRLPVEILGHTFCSLYEGGKNDGTRFDLAISEIPWTLGQVCRRWRQLSRTMPELWGMTIVSSRLPPWCFGSSIQSRGTQTRGIARALEILPEVSRISLDVSPPVPTRSLSPYFSRITELRWTLEADQKQESMEILPPGVLSNIQRLRVDLGQPSSDVGLHAKSYPDLFGKTSCLRDLTLLSDTPNFLLTDIPWDQICSLSLCTSTTVMNDCTRPTWVWLRDSINPFCSMSSLKDLTFEVTSEFLKMITSFDFPWNRLKSFKICWQYEQNMDVDLATIMPTLDKCTSLTRLEIDHHGYLSPEQTSLKSFEPIIFSKLKSLSIRGELPVFVMLSSYPFENTLQKLQIQRVRLRSLHAILRQCSHLTHLHCSVETERRGQFLTQPSTTLPHLTYLDIDVWDGLFPDLVVPVLKSLMVSQNDDIDLLSTIVNFVRNSEAKLEKFTYHCAGLSRSINPPAQHVIDLMSILKDCMTLDIPQISLPRDLVDEFATGSLLPCVRHLNIGTSSPAVFCLMIQGRLEREALFDTVKLRKVG
ncbi:hypothetical protein C0989_007824, partial [Termitomyces sp. Mn162]